MLDEFLEDIDRLKKRSELLDAILSCYNEKTMTFDIKEKWEGKVRSDKLPAESPRHLMKQKIVDILSAEDLQAVDIYGLYNF